MHFLHSRLQKWIHLQRRRVCTLISKHTWCLHYTWNTSHQKFEYNKNDHELCSILMMLHSSKHVHLTKQLILIQIKWSIVTLFPSIFIQTAVWNIWSWVSGFNHSLVLYLFHCCIDESSLQMKRNKINLLPWDETSLTTAVLTDVRTCCRLQRYKMP